MGSGKKGWWEVDGGRWEMKEKEPSRSEAARFIKRIFRQKHYCRAIFMLGRGQLAVLASSKLLKSPQSTPLIMNGSCVLFAPSDRVILTLE